MVVTLHVVTGREGIWTANVKLREAGDCEVANASAPLHWAVFNAVCEHGLFAPAFCGSTWSENIKTKAMRSSSTMLTVKESYAM